ncbi:DUF4434 domain-containing protein [Pseudidiomarina insulisalsae]|nr:DUF4434 domain-containing protein [Pseudidiomarina insulisalsae]
MATQAKSSLDLGVMYQPLNRDAELGVYGWRYLFQQLATEDIDFGVVQWVQYGNEYFAQPRNWLRQALTAWQQHMPLWIGLHSEPDYFAQMAEGEAAQQAFFNNYLRSVNGTVARWQAWQFEHQQQFLGWYIPLELSDAYFATAEKQAQLHQFLRQLRERLGTTPLAISVFMSATISPQLFGEWVNEIQQLGYEVWLQDGSGTQALPLNQRQAYYEKLNCDVVFINEAFIQTSEQPFEARPKRDDELRKTLEQNGDCHRRILFSLRYLSHTAGLLYLTDVTRDDAHTGD